MRYLKTTLSHGCVTVAPLAFALMLSTAPARADTVIAGDLDYAVPINSDATSGAGFGIRLGQQVRLPPLLSVSPEMAFTYHAFPSTGPRAYRGTLGLRLGLGEILRPGVFMHLGIGHLIPEGLAPAHTAFSYDAGAFLDFTLLPLLNLGAHAAYTGVNSRGNGSSFRWVTVGLHAALIF